MNQKKDIFIGMLIGLLSAFVGTFIALLLFTKQGFSEGYFAMKNAGLLGKIITLGCIPNILIFFLLLKKNKELMARGVILAMFLLIVITLIL